MLIKELAYNYEILAALPHFRGLQEEIILAIFDASLPKRLAAGEFLFSFETRATHLFIVKKGLIEIFRSSDGGKKIILHHATRGAFLGDTFLFRDGSYGANACALDDTELFVIEKKRFEDLIAEYPDLGVRMLRDFGGRIERLNSLVAGIAFSDVRQRILKLLIELVGNAREGCVSKAFIDGRNSVVLTSVPTQDEMAHRIGTVREVLCKGLHKIEKENLIRVKKRNIIIHDLNRLRQLVLEDEGENLFPITLPNKRP